MTECSYRHDESMRFGQSSVAAARILLHSEGECAGCDDDIDLTAEDARDAVHIHTVGHLMQPLREPWFDYRSLRLR
ncbi:hypothetical protein [Mycolicibacterium vanbaalenii]|uniref:hypothetical protein n=1 Tax=Mycolicibacterium vanbaalenii TaxID=110539 RepID=UPI00190F197D|nr:hypothetical protein [Mycolicibacterium vanbaalenii]